MAGKNTRFHDMGIDVPKYLLPFGNISVLEKILLELLKPGAITNVHLVAHLRDKTFKPELEKIMSSLGLSMQNLYYIGETDGQAETAYLASELIHNREDKPIIFHNADTVLIGRNFSALKESISMGAGFVDVFRSTSSSYSYVQVHDQHVVQIVEKKPISNFATSGLYAFHSSQEYRNAFRNSYEKVVSSRQELYISNVISDLIFEGRRFRVDSDSHNNLNVQTLVLGTPGEYNSIISKLGEAE
jgi:dTDP-glucose pyrophosphorylase